jgi:nitronate monooxygenase
MFRDRLRSRPEARCQGFDAIDRFKQEKMIENRPHATGSGQVGVRPRRRNGCLRLFCPQAIGMRGAPGVPTTDESDTMTLQQLLGIEYPIIQAPMAGVQLSALTIAVSNAGGLGSLPCAMLAPDAIRSELKSIAAGTTRPYNINFFCHAPPSPDAPREATWRRRLAPYFAEFGIDPAGIPSGPVRLPFSAEAAEVLEEFKPPVVSFHFGLPSADLLARVKRWGAKVLSSATTVDEARWLEAHGADAVIAQGLEAGGHRAMFLSDDLNTQVGSLSLVPQVARAVKVPVIAAGGIADAQAVAAAMKLGAAGAQLGTAYLLCDECTTTPVHRAALKSDAARVTALTNLFTGRPSRSIVNRLMRELGPIDPAAPRFPVAASIIAPLRAKAEAAGSGDFSPLWAGQNVTGCREGSAGDLTRSLGEALAAALR